MAVAVQCGRCGMFYNQPGLCSVCEDHQDSARPLSPRPVKYRPAVPTIEAFAFHGTFPLDFLRWLYAYKAAHDLEHARRNDKPLSHGTRHLR